MTSIEKSKQHFDNIAANYAESHDGRFCALAYDELRKELKSFRHGKWLDLSCGPGPLLALMGDTALERYGVDFSEKMIDEARRRLGDEVHLCVASAEKLPFADNTFDVVTCSFAFHHYIHPGIVLFELYRVMKPGAMLIIADPYVPQPFRMVMNPLLRFGPNGDYHMYGRRELARRVSNHGFLMEEFRRIDRQVFISKCSVIKIRS